MCRQMSASRYCNTTPGVPDRSNAGSRLRSSENSVRRKFNFAELRNSHTRSRTYRLRRWLPSRQPVASTTTAVLTSKLSQETREETSCKERRLSAKYLATSSFSDSRSALANSARRRPKYAP